MDIRKKQKRQTAGALVTGLFGGGGTNSKKKGPQPRPPIQIPPRGIGPINEPNDNDVLSGRGGRINAHPGNVQFRDMVNARKKDYLAKSTKKLEKAHIAADVVREIRSMNPSGRFLKEDADGAWYDIGDAKAIKKVGQALREDAPDIRHEIDHSDNSGDEARKDGNSTKGSKSDDESKSQVSAAVSNRGGKSSSAQAQQRVEYYQPLAYQEVAAAPTEYQPIVPPAPPAIQLNRGVLPKNAVFSGAAAAVMRQPDPTDTAFGRPFYPAEVQGATEQSMISGLSDPSMLSGMSSLSAVDRRAAIHHQNLIRHSQLQQLRQYWATQHYGSGTATDLTGNRSISIGAAGIAANILSHGSFDLNQHRNILEEMSWVENSLAGGGIRDGISVATGSMLSGASYNPSVAMIDAMVDGVIRDHPSVASAATSRAGQNLSANRTRQASNLSMEMSIASGGVESLPGSIMSDLSENLMALDLAEPKTLDSQQRTREV